MTNGVQTRLKQRHGVDGHAFAAADLTHSLVGLSLYADRVHGDAERLREGRTDAIDVRRELRLLGDDHGIHVLHDVARGLHELHRARQQPQAVGALVLRIGIGKVPADVALRGGAQNRVGDRVAQRIAVGMAFQAGGKRDVLAAEDQRSSVDRAV